MNVLFAGKSFDARHLVTTSGYVKPGDIIALGCKSNQYLFEVETVQRDCPAIENLSHIFTNGVLKDETGQKHYTRSIFGKVEIYRKR
jgi:hypothetical protein